MRPTPGAWPRVSTLATPHAWLRSSLPSSAGPPPGSAAIRPRARTRTHTHTHAHAHTRARARAHACRHACSHVCSLLLPCLVFCPASRDSCCHRSHSRPFYSSPSHPVRLITPPSSTPRALNQHRVWTTVHVGASPPALPPLDRQEQRRKRPPCGQPTRHATQATAAHQSVITTLPVALRVMPRARLAVALRGVPWSRLAIPLGGMPSGRLAVTPQGVPRGCLALAF